MNRKQFLQNSLILGGASLLPANSAFAAGVEVNGIDRLTDENGNFIQQPLPYNNNFLEPYMDEETVYLHYTFHHGNAVKAANKYLGQIRKAMDENNLETVDYQTKKLALSSPATSCTPFSGRTSVIKKPILPANCCAALKRVSVRTTA